MSRKTETKTIGAHTYQTIQLGGLKGRQVLMRILKVAGPALGVAAAAGAGGKVPNEQVLAGAFRSLADELKPEDMDYLCDVFGACSRVDIEGKMPLLKDIFDDHFSANYLEMMGWLAFCLEANFSSFFHGKGLAEALAKAST